MDEQNVTGYPSIDKPWLKYYSEAAINATIPQCSMYEYMSSGNKRTWSKTALVYLGRKISYTEMFEKACVVGIKDTEHNVGEFPVLFVISDEDKQKDLKKLIVDEVRKKLPEYYRIKDIHFVTEFPYTNAGKVDYRKLSNIAERM